MKTVILVDDEEDVVLSTVKRAARQRPDYAFEGFTDPERALERIQATAPHVLVTDVRMPKMTGMELLAAARAAAPGLPAVVVTAYGSPEVRAEVTRRGSVEYLEKPFELAELFDAIERAAQPRTGFSGAVAQLTLPDVVQLHALSRFTGTLRIVRSVQKGCLWFAGGEIRHAECGDLSGPEAAYTILAWEGGTFALGPGEVNTVSSIALPWQELLIEGCRRLDEASRSEGSNASEAVSPSEPVGLGGEATTLTEVVAVLKSIESEAPGFIGASLVDLETGANLGAYSARPDFDAAGAGVVSRQALRQSLLTTTALNLNSRVEEMLSMLSDEIHLVKMLSPRTFVHVAADRRQTNEALIRRAVAKYAARLT